MAHSFLQPSETAELAEEFKKLEEAQTISDRHRVIHRTPDELPAKADERIVGSVGDQPVPVRVTSEIT